MKNQTDVRRLLIGFDFLEITPVGSLLVTASEKGLREVRFYSLKEYKLFMKHQMQNLTPKVQKTVAEALQQLQEYFKGSRRNFEVPIDWSGLTLFTTAVLKETQKIKFGEVRTYGQMAAKIHAPKASRAVGRALSVNPLTIIIPCHRVVDREGGLHGYSAPGGLKTKSWLLVHEGVDVRDNRVLIE